MRCYFCKICSRRFHKTFPDNKTVNVRGGCLDGLTKEMMGKAVHIWTTRAVVDISEGVERCEEKILMCSVWRIRRSRVLQLLGLDLWLVELAGYTQQLLV
jgi:hypothetical protein